MTTAIGFYRLNQATTPELGEIALGKISLSWSAHARDRAVEKHVAVLQQLLVEKGMLVEIEKHGDRTTKIVVRFAQSPEWDAVFVLGPVRVNSHASSFRVITCWLNHVSDNHVTLNRERLGRVG